MLVSEAQEEDGCGCCVPIKSKWQSDLGEAKRGYNFSQTFSQGCSFSCLLLFFFKRYLWPNTGCLASLEMPVYRTELMRQSGLSAEGVEMGDWLLPITCFFDESLFKAVSIKGLSLHTGGLGKESLTQLLKSGLQGVWGAVVGWSFSFDCCSMFRKYERLSALVRIPLVIKVAGERTLVCKTVVGATSTASP